MYYLGIDLGGTNIAVGLVNDELRMVSKESLPTPATDPLAIVDTMAALCHRLMEKEGISLEQIAYAGIASPGIVDRERGEAIYANNIRFDHFPLARLLRERIPLKAVYMENDANAAALGEAKAGGARGTKNSVMITLGTGVGGGIIIDGRVYMGFNFAGGASSGLMPSNSRLIVDFSLRPLPTTLVRCRFRAAVARGAAMYSILLRCRRV